MPHSTEHRSRTRNLSSRTVPGRLAQRQFQIAVDPCGAFGYSEPRIPQRKLVAAVLISLFLHVLLLVLIRTPEETIEKPIELTLISLPKQQPVTAQKPPQQITSPSEQANNTPPLETAFRAETDSSVEKQQIRRGMPDAGTPQTTTSSQPAPPPPPVDARATDRQKSAPPPQKKVSTSERASNSESAKPDRMPKKTVTTKPNTSAPSLRLSDELIASQIPGMPVGSAADQEKARSEEKTPATGETFQPDGLRPKSDAELAKALREYQPFRHSQAGSIWNPRSGTPDHLPTIQDGEVTMLNTKADHFAVFVRRVALQVFGSLRQRTWTEMNARSVIRLDGFAVVEAVMSPKGKLLSAELRTTSGAQRFDVSLIDAAKVGTWDQNPPPAARAADGNYHFIFQARLWARRDGNGLGEQRWLLLSTGLL